MKKFLAILTIAVTLLLIESILLFITLQLYDFIKYPISLLKFNHALKSTIEIVLILIIFYLPIWICVFYIIYSQLLIKYKIIKLIAFNAGLYVLNSMCLTMIFPFAIEFFYRDFFYMLILVKILSPTILYIVAPCNKLVYSLITSDKLPPSEKETRKAE